MERWFFFKKYERSGKMLQDAFTFGKLLDAHKKCRCSKQHKKETITFELNLSKYLATLSHDLLHKTYKLGKYKQFYIYEPKKRNIEALSYKDRVVLMALCQHIIEPKMEKRLIYDNVACRKGKGTHFGLKRLEEFLHEYYKEYKSNQGYFLKCDIKKYFQSIDHKVLFDHLCKMDFDEEDRWILRLIIDSKYQEEGIGLPIGNQTSQWFGLFYLDRVDRLIKEQLHIRYYVRYMDDMILVHHDKAYLKYCKNRIEQCCEKVLHLSLNQKTQIAPLKSGIDFLGFRTILTPSGKVIRLLRSQAKTRLRHNMRTLSRLKEQGLVDDEYVKVRLNAYQAHLCHSQSYQLLKNYQNRYPF